MLLPQHKNKKMHNRIQDTMTRTDPAYMKTKHNYTPSDYDIQLPLHDIPSNINYLNANNLTQHLQSKTPLTRKIHIQLTKTNINTTNTITTNFRPIERRFKTRQRWNMCSNKFLYISFFRSGSMYFKWLWFCSNDCRFFFDYQ